MDNKKIVIYYAPIEKKYFSKWDYYQVDLDMLSSTFDEVIVCHNPIKYIWYILTKKIDLTYSWWWHRSSIIALISKFFFIPVYITGAIHMFDESGSPDFYTKSFFYRLSSKISLRYASANLFISESQQRQICSHLKVNNPHLLKSSLRKDYNYIEVLESKKEIDKIDHKVFLTISWLTDDQLNRKSVYETALAIKILADNNYDCFTWIIAGEDGGAFIKLRDYIYKLGISDYVEVRTKISNKDKENLYNLADLYIQPSFHEGFGNAVLEAMSYGVPALVSRYTSQPEVVKNSGFIINEISGKFISSVLIRYLKMDKSRKDVLCKTTLETVNQNHLFKFRKDTFIEILNKNN